MIPIPRMPRVMIISYYFPPMGGVEVQRMTRFARHLPEFGWEPIILTTNGAFHTVKDSTLLAMLPAGLQIRRVGALDHFLQVRRKKRLKQGTATDREFRNSHRFGDRFLRRIEAFDRKYLCFPDEMNWWAWKAFLPAVRLVRSLRPDVILATGFPWSTLALGNRISHWTGVPLVLDIRDSWTTDPRNWWSSDRHQRLEFKVFKSASQIVCATDQMRLQYEYLYPGLPFWTVHNACADPRENTQEGFLLRSSESCVRFVYTGSLTLGHGRSPQSRTPVFFLKALLELLKNEDISRSKVMVDFYGVHPEEGYDLNDPDQWLLDDVVRWHGSISHEKARQVQKESDVLLLFQARGFEFAVGGKFFEYLMTKKPILACVPESGEVASIIKKLSIGTVSNLEDVGRIKAALRKLIAHPFTDPQKDVDLGPYTLSGAMRTLVAVLEAARVARKSQI